MAIVRCAECNNEISDTAKQCPHCGAPRAKAIPPKPAGPAAWIGAGIVALLVFSCVSGGEGSSSNTKSSRNMDQADALIMCQMALTRVSRDPETAKIPYVPNQGSDTEFYFVWNGSTKMARMRNGLGLEVAVSASCIVDGRSRQIKSLTLDGKTII